MKKIFMCLAILALGISTASAKELKRHHSYVSGDTGMAISVFGGANTGHVTGVRTFDLGDLTKLGATEGEIPSLFIDASTYGNNVAFDGDITDIFSNNFNDNFKDNFKDNFSDNTTESGLKGQNGNDMQQSLKMIALFFSYLRGDYYQDRIKLVEMN